MLHHSSASANQPPAMDPSSKLPRRCPYPPSSILDLLDDRILLSVFEKLRSHGDRNSWSLVCKRFFHIRASGHSFTLLRAHLLPSFLASHSHIRSLNLSPCTYVSDTALAHLAHNASPYLQSLNLSKVCTFTDAGLASLSRRCSSLTALDLSFCSQLTDVGMVALSAMNGLQSLKLVQCEAITDAGMVAMTSGCGRLLHLNLRWCSGISDWTAIAIGSNCKELRSLDLSYTEISNIGLASVKNLKHLESLSLVACHSIDDEGLAHLKHGCKTLQMLDVSRCQSVSYGGLVGLADGFATLQHLSLSYSLPVTDALLQSIRKLEGLQSIRLDGCDVSAADLSLLGGGCKALKELSLSKCRGVTDTGLSAALAGCQVLRKLDLTCCQELTDSALSSLAMFASELVSLKMESCRRISKAGFSSLGNACPKLEELDLTDTNLNDSGLMSLANCPGLKVLKAGFCFLISSKGLEHISYGCPNLEELDVYRSTGIGDDGVAAIATRCSKLKILNLSYCTEITDKALQSIAQCRELYNLEIRGCASITSVGLAAVGRGCIHLVELDVKRCSSVDDTGVLVLAHHCTDLQQVNLSYTAVTDQGLIAAAKLNRMKNMKLVHLNNVSVSGFEAALSACCGLRKVKLLPQLRDLLPHNVLKEVENRGCRFRWIQKLH